MYLVKDNEHAKELIKLDFSENLIASPESCENWLNHCNIHNMKFLKGSYGTLVHKDFNKYFKRSRSYNRREDLKCTNSKQNFNLHLDHTNLLKSKIYGNVYILTSSPYSLPKQVIEDTEEYPYNRYFIHPDFLTYYVFIDNGPSNPYYNVNYAFTTASDEQMNEINRQIHENTGLFEVFIRF